MPRQIYCRYCGVRGHNIVTCSLAKAYAAANPDSYLAVKINTRKTQKNPSRCSYCKETDHNRARCKHYMNDVIRVSEINKRYRLKLIKYLKENNIGVGTLVKVARAWGYDKEGNCVDYHSALALVVDLDMEASFNKNIFNDFVSGEFLTLQFCTVKQYDNSAKKITVGIRHIDIQHDLERNPKFRGDPMFEVVSSSFFEMKNEEDFCVEKGSVLSILKHHETHNDINNELKKLSDAWFKD